MIRCAEVITKAVRAEYRAMVLLAAWCGLRFGEPAELRRKDIDLEHGRVQLRRAVTHVEGRSVVGPPKPGCTGRLAGAV